jgi:hypothetical protein
MLAIAGAILIHAACILMATTKEPPDIYPMRLFLIVVGSGLIGADLACRFLELRKKLRESAQTQTPKAEEGAAPNGTSLSPNSVP